METSIQVLSAAEREQVHERTLTVLGKTGMRCDTAEGRRILAGAGAQVDESTHVVRFPAELVERSLAAATTTYTLGGRRPGWSYALNEGNFTLLADGGATAVFDAKTGERRPTCHDDWVKATTIHDALDDVARYPEQFGANLDGARDRQICGAVGRQCGFRQTFPH